MNITRLHHTAEKTAEFLHGLDMVDDIDDVSGLFDRPFVA